MSELESGAGSSGERASIVKTVAGWLRRHGGTLRVVTTVVLIAVLLSQVSFGELHARLRGLSADWPLLILAALLPGIGVVLSAQRWRVILAGLDKPVPMTVLVRGQLVGVFFNQLLPSTIGGDLARSWWTHRNVGSHMLSLTVVAIDRLIGLIGICAVAFAAALLSPDVVATMPMFWLTGLIPFAVIGLLLVFSHPRTAIWGRRLLTLPGFRLVRDKAAIAYQGIAGLRARWSRLGTAFALSVALMVEIVALYVLIAFAFDMPVSASALAVLVPIVSMIAMLPVTINGIGLREGALAVLGAPFGMTMADAIVLAWTVLLLQSLYAVLGGFVYMAGRHATPEATVSH